MSMFPRDTFYTVNNVPLNKALFFEFHQYNNSRAVFTLKSYDNQGCLSLSKLFLAYTVQDPSEHTFAETVFGEWITWERLSEADGIKPHVEAWRRAADVARKSKAFKAVVSEVEDGNFQAAKFLIQEPWKDTPKEKKEAKETTKEAFGSITEDISRLEEKGLLN